MDFLRKHWYDLGAVFAILVLVFVLVRCQSLTDYQVLMWVSLCALFLHQLEEYRIVGTFPGMVNRVLFQSELPDRYPLNTNSAFYVNVVVGWLSYSLAAVFAERAIWLGLATMLVSLGNTVAHSTLFNIKGKTLYNAGLVSSILLFAPCVYFFCIIVWDDQLIGISDLLIGIPLGAFLNVVGILKLIDWMADKHTRYIFEQRNLLKRDRIG